MLPAGPSTHACARAAGEPREQCIDAALEYLTTELRRVRAPLSLAWGLIGMRAWNAQPPEARAWLDACAQRLMEHPAAPLYDSLLLLAGADDRPLTGMPEVQADD